MTRYVAIALMNLLVIGSISASALARLFRGCSIDGTCTGESNTLTWVLGVGLSLAVIVALSIIVRIVLKRRRHGANQDIAIVVMPRAADAASDYAAPDDGDEAMLSRLSRMTRTVGVDTAGVDADRSAQPEFDADEYESDVASAFGQANDAADDIVEDVLDANAVSSDFDDDDSDAIVTPSINEITAPDLHVVVRDGERAAPRNFSFEAEAEYGNEEAQRFAWLFDDAAGTNAAQVRHDMGFPWSVAGIDHVCQAISCFGPMLAGTEFASEASAWCQVTASLPRGEALSEVDVVAFTDWLNAGLWLIERSGKVVIKDAMESLAVEAASDPEVARRLPRDFWTDDHSDDSQFARFG